MKENTKEEIKEIEERLRIKGYKEVMIASGGHSEIYGKQWMPLERINWSRVKESDCKFR